MKKNEFTKHFVLKSAARTLRNNDIATFYELKAQNDQMLKFEHKADRLRLCFKYWDVDFFRRQRTKDVKRINACKDLFCKNCQHNLSLKRFAKYSPFLDKLSEDYDIFHVVFTVPNVKGIDLRDTLKKMYAKYAYVNQYFRLNRKARGFDFGQFGYVGSVKALEVTYKKLYGDITYHPHFHCLFILKKDLDFKKVDYNKFSFSLRDNDVKSFSKFEILLQKLWFLLLNGEKFTEKNFKDLKSGYSCTADKCKNGKYHEVFKYALGGIFKKGIDLNYDIFNTLYNALNGRRIIQGYGILNGFKFDDNKDDELMEYLTERANLELFEKPEAIHDSLERVLEDMDNNIRYISKFKKNYEE